MLAIEIWFWVLVGVLVYLYVGYPLVLLLFCGIRRRKGSIAPGYAPSVSLIIAAYNEEAVIAEKIENSLALDYPGEKLEIIVFSDASSDRTDDIVTRFADRGVKLLRIEGRKGKTHCQNEAVRVAQGEVLVFSDANSMYEPQAIHKLVQHFADERVGCVSGELRYHSGEEAVEGERTYWRYEQLLKKLESSVSSLVGANGSVYAIRRSLYRPLRATAASDFVEPLKIVQERRQVVYEPAAVAWESTAEGASAEYRRRVRIVGQAVRSLLEDRYLLLLVNPLRYGVFALQLSSHKILRWLSGLFLILALALNIPLVGYSLVYAITMAGQGLFYLLAAWGLAYEVSQKRAAPRLPHIAYYFCLSCYGMLRGVLDGVLERSAATWTPSR